MPRTETLEAIVLRSVDVGEADRFVIFFTKERGRIAVRVPAARRLGSSRAGTLSSAHLSVAVRPSNAGFSLEQMQTIGSPVTEPLAAFVCVSQALELLLQVLQEEDPQEELFHSTLHFLRSSKIEAESAFLAFGICFLSHLGVLPDPDHLPTKLSVTDEERQFIHAALRHQVLPRIPNDKSLRALLKFLLPSVLVSPLKGPSVAQAMR